MQFPWARLLIFAKAPCPGQAKTRLIPVLGPVGAARLQRVLTRRLVGGWAAARLCPCELWVSPDPRHPSFRALARCYRVTLHTQQGVDLGERMAGAVEDALGRSEAIVLVGSDCPGLTPAMVAWTLRKLESTDAVLGPAEDGGYVLLALRRPAPSLFAEMPWGSERVAGLTRQRLATLGWRWCELPPLWDLDRPGDLERWRQLGAGLEIRRPKGGRC